LKHPLNERYNIMKLLSRNAGIVYNCEGLVQRSAKLQHLCH
jgi:hypothetical protein